MRRAFDSACIYRLILGVAALLIPHPERAEWLAEWKAELWHLLSAKSPAHFGLNVARFCLGSWKDAAWLRSEWLRWNAEKPLRPPRLWLRSPTQCISFLTTLAAATSFLAFHESLLQSTYISREFMLGQLLVLGAAMLMLSTFTPLALGDYSAASGWPTRMARFRRWIFLGVKFALLLAIVFCGTLDLGLLIAPAELAPHATFVGDVLAFRWALVDQRRRCPVCLRLLTNPIRIGRPTHTIFDWYGAEFICPKGHGLLYVPATPTTSYTNQRWLYLDPSWQSLFVDPPSSPFRPKVS